MIPSYIRETLEPGEIHGAFKVMCEQVSRYLNIQHIFSRQRRHRRGTDMVNTQRKVTEHIPQHCALLEKFIRPGGFVCSDGNHFNSY